MTATATTQTTTPKTSFEFGDAVTFTNQWGQKNCFARVMWQDGDTLSIDYLGCQHKITLDQLT